MSRDDSTRSSQCRVETSQLNLNSLLRFLLLLIDCSISLLVAFLATIAVVVYASHLVIAADPAMSSFDDLLLAFCTTLVAWRHFLLAVLEEVQSIE